MDPYISKRVQALSHAGYTVTRLDISSQTTLSMYLNICRLAFHHAECFIHIEGNGIVDKLTLIKLVNPRLTITWDIRSVLPVTAYNQPIKRLYVFMRHTLKRYILSFLVSNYRFISPLQMTIPRLLTHKSTSVIQDIVQSNRVTKEQSRIASIIQKLIPPHSYVVVCLSNPQSHNTALDLIEKVAHSIHKKNKNILFILVGEHPWHTTVWNKNILFINPLPKEVRYALLRQSDISLALYKNIFSEPYIDEPSELRDYARFRLPCITSLPSAITRFATPSQYLTSTSINDVCTTILSLKANKP